MSGRDKILKEGYVKFRQSSVPLQRWKQRYLVFKITQAGRLQLIVYKETPATAVNEIKEISIDEFGGLENNLRLEGEKYVFAIITTTTTECFSVETPQELSEWSKLLQEYLGKELLVNINVPSKQPLLRMGKAVLRIRNTGFTISTCENPPRCQGTWQIIHIRKYGGTDIFRFQTGSKCPTGEHLYFFETKDNAGLKKLFSDLSNHKPIFADDRLGRRMTLEKTFNSKVTTQPDSPIRTSQTRRSLQVDRGPPQPVYENRELLHTLPEYTNVSELTVPGRNMRRRSYDDSVFTNETEDTITSQPHAAASRKPSQDNTYQNMSKSGRPNVLEVVSPTKKSHAAISVPVPDGYYNFPPPSLLTKNYSKGRYPSSSPDEDRMSIHEIQASLKSPTTSISQLSTDRYSPEVAMDAVGDKTTRQLSPNFEIQPDGTYQNLEFMRGSLNDSSKRYAPELARVDTTTAAATPEGLHPHEYTNVQLRPTSTQSLDTCNAANLRKQKLSEVASLDLGTKPKTTREPFKRNKPSTLTSLQQSSSIDTLLDSHSLGVFKSELRNSLSDHELSSSSSASKQIGRPMDYYNFCAPNLPAHSQSREASINFRKKFTLTVQTPHLSNTPSDYDSTELLSPEFSMAGEDYSKMIPVGRNEAISREGLKEVVSIADAKFINETKCLSSSCDCLTSSDSSGAAFLDNHPDSHNALYDKLLPKATNEQSMYDSLGPYKDNPKSGSCSPDASSNILNSASILAQPSTYLRPAHNYEDIDSFEEEQQQGTRSGSLSPTRMELPSEWTSSLQHKDAVPTTTENSHQRLSRQSPNTQSRKKHLPLQEYKHVSDKPNGHSHVSARHFSEHTSSHSNKPRPPKLSRGQSVDVKSQPNPDQEFSIGVLSDPISSISHSQSSLELSADDHCLREDNFVSRSGYETVSIKSVRSLHQTSIASQPTSQAVQAPPIPSRTFKIDKDQDTSLNKKKGNVATTHISINSSPPLPPRSNQITVPLPQAQFNFKPKPPPKPKMLMTGTGSGPDPYYTSVSFLDGTASSVPPSRDSPIRVPPRDIPARIPRPKAVDSELGSYVSVDFELTKGLQKTSEQVAHDHKAYFESTQHN